MTLQKAKKPTRFKSVDDMVNKISGPKFKKIWKKHRALKKAENEVLKAAKDWQRFGKHLIWFSQFKLIRAVSERKLARAIDELLKAENKE